MKAKKIVSALGIAGAASFALCLAVLNITNVSTAATKPGVTLSNVAVMQASAAEYSCDMNSSNLCTFVWGGITYYSTGRLIVTF